MRITRRVALRRGTTEVDGTRTPRRRDKRFIVLSFYAPDSLECELHYFSRPIVARTLRRYDIQIAATPRAIRANNLQQLVRR